MTRMTIYFKNKQTVDYTVDVDKQTALDFIHQKISDGGNFFITDEYGCEIYVVSSEITFVKAEDEK